MRHFYWPSLKFSSDNCGCFPPPAPAPYYWDSIKSLRRWDCHCPWVAWSGARGQFKQCTELYSKHALFQLRIYKGILPEHTKCYYRILQFSCAWSRPSVTMVAGCKMLWGWSQQLVSPHQHSTAPHTRAQTIIISSSPFYGCWAEHCTVAAGQDNKVPSVSLRLACPHPAPADTLSSAPGYRVQSWHQCQC